MVGSIARTLGQLGDPRLRGVLVAAVLATLALIVAMAFGVGLAIDALATTGIGWLDGTLAVIGALGTVVLALLFFPGTVQVISGVFADRVADAVEARHYPGLGPARDQPLAEILADSLRFAGLSILLNLIALPLYLVPGVNLLLFYSLNGYLLGREYAEMIAVRRMDKAAIRAFRQKNQGALFLSGVVIAVISTIPLLNLATPVLATAFARHEHARLARRGQESHARGN